MPSKHSDFGIVFLLHFSLILLFWLLPFLFNWKLVIVGCIIYYINTKIEKLCILTKVQLNTNDEEESVYHYYLEKYFKLNIDKKKVKFFVRWILPVCIFLFSLFWQLILGVKPLII